jgi:cardiolipin synthase
MIREARSFVYLSAFYVEWDAYSVELLNALGDARARGAEVNLLIDGFGQRLGAVLMSSADRQALSARLDDLRSSGATVSFYKPARLAQRLLGGGQHVKIQLSEGGEAIFGSSNITKTSFEGWNEYAVAVRGPITRTLLESYREIGGTVSDRHLQELDEVCDDTSADHELDYWLCNPNTGQGLLGPLGWQGENEVTSRMIEMLDAARTSVCITSFYFKPVEPLMAALVRAAKRGVHIEVFHSHRDALPATDLAWIAAAVNYDRLLSSGVTVFENRHGEHSKIILVDDAWAAFGSYNFEDAAHDRLAEAMMSSRDSRAVEPAAAIFADLRRDPDNTVVTWESLAGLPEHVRKRIARFGRFKWWM